MTPALFHILIDDFSSRSSGATEFELMFVLGSHGVGE